MNIHGLQPCTHEEADYRMLLHAYHAYQQGSRNIMIYAEDTDVLVICIAFANCFENSELWLAFGHSKHFRLIATHVIAQVLGNSCSKGLLMLHAISGCDTVSAI